MDRQVFFTLNCSLRSPVTTIADFQFTETFSGNSTPMDYIIEIKNISQTEQSITLEFNGTFMFPEDGVIQVKCLVSNSNGNDNATTNVTRCGKGTL